MVLRLGCAAVTYFNNLIVLQYVVIPKSHAINPEAMALAMWLRTEQTATSRYELICRVIVRGVGGVFTTKALVPTELCLPWNTAMQHLDAETQPQRGGHRLQQP